MALLAFIDLFILVIPTDALLVGAVILHPKQWLYIALLVALGSALGSAVFAEVIHHHGLPFLLHLKPGIDQTSVWLWSKNLMEKWGDWALFGISLSPIIQHPAVAMGTLAGMATSRIFLVIFAARTLKYSLFAWLASHAPRVLGRIWPFMDTGKKS